ncbi:hypothetical protein V7138_10225 [Bacillus sp. JJ1533]
MLVQKLFARYSQKPFQDENWLGAGTRHRKMITKKLTNAWSAGVFIR